MPALWAVARTSGLKGGLHVDIYIKKNRNEHRTTVLKVLVETVAFVLRIEAEEIKVFK